MSTPKQSRRKTGAKKLEPIDWHEFANDAVLNGNMSTLYRRPPTEDPTAYASPEALVEIEKRFACPVPGPAASPAPAASVPTVGTMPLVRESSATVQGSSGPTVGGDPPVGSIPSSHVVTADYASGSKPADPALNAPFAAEIAPDTYIPTVDKEPTVDFEPTDVSLPAAGLVPTVGSLPISSGKLAVGPQHATTVPSGPTAGLMPTPEIKRKVKPIRSVQDALTLAGRVLYNAMYGSPDSTSSKSCMKGYRQLAAETHLDKDTVRDLISEFKSKGIVRETGKYNSDTRSSKTYEVFSDRAILQIWRNSGLGFVTIGRQRPMFCTPQGEIITLIPQWVYSPEDQLPAS